MKDTIEKILTQSYTIHHLTITDDSHLHAGHKEAIASGGGHFSVLIVSDNFTGKTLIQRHRMVYDALRKELKEGIHALAIKAMTVEEFSAMN